MSEKKAKQEDVRVRRTKDLLGDALVALQQEKPFEQITVQDLLARANVSRSTFYAHFRDKQDLFLSDMDEFLEMMATALSTHKDKSDRLAPVMELCAHVAEMRKLYEAQKESGTIHEFLELAQEHFARGIEKRLGEIPRAQNVDVRERPVMAQALAGSMLTLLKWWMDRGCPIEPKAIDEIFHRMAWAGVVADDTAYKFPNGKHQVLRHG
jgi:AcrR family transcriptional regulator